MCPNYYLYNLYFNYITPYCCIDSKLVQLDENAFVKNIRKIDLEIRRLMQYRSRTSH